MDAMSRVFAKSPSNATQKASIGAKRPISSHNLEEIREKDTKCQHKDINLHKQANLRP